MYSTELGAFHIEILYAGQDQASGQSPSTFRITHGLQLAMSYGWNWPGRLETSLSG